MSDDCMKDGVIEDGEYIDIDLSKVMELDDQKTYCQKMFKVLELEESILKKRFLGAQTLIDFMDANIKVKAEVSEFVGYNYGNINQCMVLVDSAVLNLKKFHEGGLDDIEDSARGMFISLWYNIGITHLDSVKHMMNELEGLEQDLLENIANSTDEDILEIKKATLH